MIRALVSLFFLSIPSLSFAQEQLKEEPVPEMYSPTSIIEEQNKIYERVELEPQFSTDHRTLKPWIMKEIEFARSQKKLQKVAITVTLLIEKNGIIGDVIFPESVNKKIKKETLEIIKRMPSWRAAQQNGRPVRAYANVEFLW
jgi:hypothetical protein